MIKFPSYIAAIIAGAIGMPLFLLVTNYIEDTFESDALMLLWLVVGFGIPVIISTANIKYVRKCLKEGRSLFRPWATAEDFKQLYIPTWLRMLVWFASTITSTLILNLVGIQFA